MSPFIGLVLLVARDWKTLVLVPFSILLRMQQSQKACIKRGGRGGGGGGGQG